MKERLDYSVLFDKVFLHKNLLIRYTLINLIHQVRVGIKKKNVSWKKLNNSVLCCVPSASAIAIRSSISDSDFMILRAVKDNLFNEF